MHVRALIYLPSTVQQSNRTTDRLTSREASLQVDCCTYGRLFDVMRCGSIITVAAATAAIYIPPVALSFASTTMLIASSTWSGGKRDMLGIRLRISSADESSYRKQSKAYQQTDGSSSDT